MTNGDELRQQYIDARVLVPGDGDAAPDPVLHAPGEGVLRLDGHAKRVAARELAATGEFHQRREARRERRR